ncbi:MAG: PAS domain-containing sensor histidine kinase [Alphaproteobacteria bacterium]|nr:PAS domain-containing sensor histidine kinase [Alphaproteobacteria bacterium]
MTHKASDANNQKNADSKRLSVSSLISKVTHWKRKRLSWRSIAAVFLVLSAIASGFATYAALNETPPFGRDTGSVIWLMNIDLIILLLLASLIARRIVMLWSGRKRGLAGSHLHVRLVYVFSILAAAPVIIMTVFSAFFFHFGVQAWFSQRVQTAINESQAVAQSYLEEHKQVIRADTLAMADDLNRQADILLLNPRAFDTIMDTQSSLRNLSEALVFDEKGKIIARAGLTFALELEKVPPYALHQADESGDVVLMTTQSKDRVRALVKLHNFENTYLFVGRMVDPQVLKHLRSTEEATQDYNDLQSKYGDLQVTVTLLFVVVGLLLLFAAIWSGLILARQLVTPISHLIFAADRVRAGDLTAHVNEDEDMEEFEFLAKSFNRMTRQIQQQRNELIEANRQIDSRRRLTESVLSGVSSGVLGVDKDGTINLANASAASLLEQDVAAITGQPLTKVLPELEETLEKAGGRAGKITQTEIEVVSASKTKHTFLFRISTEKTGMIVTFDDITELVSAQRKAAWSDVARRIAHEIKNPLTPIQLSAERLRKKYMNQIQTDQETFARCTETIIRHVGDIGRMVDEFSAFARMPEPVLRDESLLELTKDSLILSQQAHREITFKLNEPTPQINYKASIDAQQVRQALTNLIRNAVDSVHSQFKNETGGKIDILIAAHGKDELFIAVTDNGQGFPEGENPATLTEPYVTHKRKGTGLGLAIVKKIMEDHGGQIILGTPSWLKDNNNWQDLGGACVVLLFPAKTERHPITDSEIKTPTKSNPRKVA